MKNTPFFVILTRQTPSEAQSPGFTTDVLESLGLGPAPPWIDRTLLLLIASLLAFLAFQIARRLILRGIHGLARKSEAQWDDILIKHRVFQRLTHMVPALVFHLTAPLVFPEPELRAVFLRLVLAYMVVAGALALNALLSALTEIYETSFETAGERPIRSYVQVVSIFLWILATILLVGALTGRSPWALLGGLGALTAVLMLVFKDSILGLVASIQLTANDMVRIGDWIELPQFGADGTVEEVLLTTVKVRNWDKTISTIPSYQLISDAFKNWRGMSESGVRRIRRSILIDMHSVRFIDADMLNRFRKIHFLSDYLDEKTEELRKWNAERGFDDESLVNGRRLTNLGTFRYYLTAYLRHHPEIDQELTLMVHQLPPTEKGLPLQLYVFSQEQRWAFYEAIMADIFDHVLAVVPLFDLQVVQMPTGADFRRLGPASEA